MSTVNEIVNWVIDNYDWLSILTIVLIFTFLSIRYFRNRDREDPESVLFLIIAVFMGILSVVPALLFSEIFSLVVQDRYQAAIVAPVAEEIAKGLFLAILVRTRLIRDPMDGLVYGAMIGTGFATIENFVYAFNQFSEMGLFSGLFLASFRSIFIVIGHPLYTGITGYGMGKYKMGEGRKWGKLWQAIVLHSLWNATLSFFIQYSLITFPIVVIFSIIVLRIYVRRARNY